jgi:hypothetical protein
MKGLLLTFGFAVLSIAATLGAYTAVRAWGMKRAIEAGREEENK